MTTREVEVLLGKLCTKYGFCLPPEAIDQILARPAARTHVFTDAVFTHEGIDPASADRHLYRQVRAAIAEAFRASALAAGMFTPGFSEELGRPGTST